MRHKCYKSGGLREPDNYGKHALSVDEDAIYSFNRKMSEAYRPDYFITLDTFLGDTKATDRAHANLTRKVRLFFRRLSNKTKQHIRYVCWYDQAPTSGKLHIHGSVTFEKFIIPESWKPNNYVELLFNDGESIVVEIDPNSEIGEEIET